MYFKIIKDTPLFNKMTELSKEILRCNKAAKKFVNNLGYSEYRRATMCVAGGVSSIVCPDGKPDGWKNSFTGIKNEFMPSKANKSGKELWKQIDVLPKVEYEVFYDLIKYDYHDSSTNHISFNPSVNWFADYVLVKTGEQYENYKPVRGMKEIKASEYHKLLEGGNKKKKAKK